VSILRKPAILAGLARRIFNSLRRAAANQLVSHVAALQGYRHDDGRRQPQATSCFTLTHRKTGRMARRNVDYFCGTAAAPAGPSSSFQWSSRSLILSLEVLGNRVSLDVVENLLLGYSLREQTPDCRFEDLPESELR